MKQPIVFFDIDGTLLDDKKVIPESTKKAVRQLQDKGIQTVIATGRVPKMFYWIQKELNIDSYVSMNGQYVVYKGKEVYSNPIKPSVLQSMSAITARNGHALAYCSHEDYKVSERNHPFIEASFDSLMMPYPEVDKEYYNELSIYQGHLYCGIEDAQQYIDLFPDFSFVKWHDVAYDILPRGASKAIGIRRLLEVLDMDEKSAFAFGDGLNDIEMLTTVGTGVAMGNAVPEAKAAADVITTSSSKNGILNGLIKVGLLEEGLAS
ncbi:hydrolase Cof [Bacillus sp. AFS076308]|uniref:Cof-type HAD-IIB family hydrolase n=1 Tax=unclassified Bacillus (in: firmicutes) TaxID=185979 RepID=UPI000BF3CF15|nr:MULTISPECIES: Cof-type HAD-IIB family hydrolase [unclassified Bacillus (in: firmicutes)]PFN82320.1 hydrolase Cof [Bacillus sp. AFS076308]PGV48181.1 hydrolase Cof [Bacillus sp. AFS037270]